MNTVSHYCRAQDSSNAEQFRKKHSQPRSGASPCQVLIARRSFSVQFTQFCPAASGMQWTREVPGKVFFLFISLLFAGLGCSMGRSYHTTSLQVVLPSTICVAPPKVWWRLSGNNLTVTIAGCTPHLRIFAVNEYFSVAGVFTERQVDADGLLLNKFKMTLPMSGDFYVAVEGVKSASLFTVTVRENGNVGSFVRCRDTGLMSCLFSNVAVNRYGFKFFCSSCRIHHTLNISAGFKRFKPVRISIMAHDLVWRHEDRPAVYVSLDWDPVFYHYQVESILPLFNLAHDFSILEQEKVLVSTTDPPDKVQMHCFGFRKYTVARGLVSYSRLVVGFSSLLDGSGLPPSHVNECTRLLFNRLGPWRYYHNRCFGRRKEQKHTLLLLNRPKKSHRCILNEEMLVERLHAQQMPNWDIVHTTMEKMSFAEQYQLAQAADIFLAIHRSGMTHFLFMRPNAAVIEISPYFFCRYHNFTERALCAGVRQQVIETKRSSCEPKSRRLRREIEKNPNLFEESVKHRKNIRDQNIFLDHDELDHIIFMVRQAAATFTP